MTRLSAYGSKDRSERCRETAAIARELDGVLRYTDNFPTAYFGHRPTFGLEGRYGAWLLEQPVLLVAHNSIFVHGGVSQAFADLPGETINATLKQQLREYIGAMAQLVAADVLSPIDDFYDHPATVAAFEQRVAADEAAWTGDIEAAAARITELNDALILDLASPI